MSPIPQRSAKPTTTTTDDPPDTGSHHPFSAADTPVLIQANLSRGGTS